MAADPLSRGTINLSSYCGVNVSVITLNMNIKMNRTVISSQFFYNHNIEDTVKELHTYIYHIISYHNHHEYAMIYVAFI